MLENTVNLRLGKYRMETLWWLLCGWRVPWQAPQKGVEQKPAVEKKDHGIHVRGFHDPVFRVFCLFWGDMYWRKLDGQVLMHSHLVNVTVDGWNPANQLRLVVYPFIPLFIGFQHHPRWLYSRILDPSTVWFQPSERAALAAADVLTSDTSLTSPELYGLEFWGSKNRSI